MIKLRDCEKLLPASEANGDFYCLELVDYRQELILLISPVQEHPCGLVKRAQISPPPFQFPLIRVGVVLEC